MEWLTSLETTVKEAGRTIADLRRQNRSLKAKVRRLEKSAKDSVSGSPDEVRRQKEARQRLDRLAEQLEQHLDG